MRALVVRQLGNPLKAAPGSPPLELDSDCKSPSLGSGQVRISVSAASINFADVLMVQVSPALPSPVYRTGVFGCPELTADVRLEDSFSNASTDKADCTRLPVFD